MVNIQGGTSALWGSYKQFSLSDNMFAMSIMQLTLNLVYRDTCASWATCCFALGLEVGICTSRVTGQPRQGTDRRPSLTGPAVHKLTRQRILCRNLPVGDAQRGSQLTCGMRCGRRFEDFDSRWMWTVAKFWTIGRARRRANSPFRHRQTLHRDVVPSAHTTRHTRFDRRSVSDIRRKL